MTPNARFVLRSAVLIPVTLAMLASDCSFSGFLPFPRPPVVVLDFVDVELINDSPFDPVDPGLFVDGALFDDLPLAPGEASFLTFNCFAGTTLQTDAILLTPVGGIPSDEFLCGDTVSFIFVDNGIDPFFTRVEVNGVFVTDKPIRNKRD